VILQSRSKGDSAAHGVVCPDPPVGRELRGKLTSISSACAEDFASNATFPRLFLSSLLEPFVLILGFPQPWKT